MPISQRLHLLMVGMVFASIIAGTIVGKLARTMAEVHRRARVLGIWMIAVWLVYNAYYFHPAVFTLHTSLPLHVCDLLGPCSAVAITWGSRPARTILYFCGIALAGQAVLTPTGDQDPVKLRFWLYWGLHAGILTLSAFDLFVVRYRPTLLDLRQMIMIDFLYVLIIAPVNAFFGWNYGYLGNEVPDTLTAINLLGPWPQRIFVMLTVVIALQAVLLTPWVLIPTKNKGSGTSPEEPSNG
jgi:hypothetical integral membrane protein (TIGR02206 family)